MKAPLSGIVPPLITPLKGRDELDVAGLERLIEHVIGGGVSGLFILGTTGEGPSLGYRLRKELIERTCEQVKHRVPVLVGITDTAFVEAVNVARWSAEAGADAVVLAPPYYLPGGQPELQEFVKHLVPELALPLFLYNMPALTKVPFDLGVVRWGMDQERIIGLKDSSGNMSYLHSAIGLLKHRPDWSVLVGPEDLLGDGVLAGAHGGVNGGANLFPALYLRMFEAASAGNIPRVRELQSCIMRIRSDLYQIGRHSSAIIKGIKCSLSVLGMCDDFMAEPFHRFRSGERERVRAVLDEITPEIKRLSAAS